MVNFNFSFGHARWSLENPVRHFNRGPEAVFLCAAGSATGAPLSDDAQPTASSASSATAADCDDRRLVMGRP
jgi:hypothetical protein